MQLSKKLEGEKIRLINVKGELFEGVVSDYIYPEDNEPEGISCICIDKCPQRPGEWIGFNEDEIKSIEIL